MTAILAGAVGANLVAFEVEFFVLSGPRLVAGAEAAWSWLIVAIPLIVAVIPFLVGLVGGMISRTGWGVVGSVGGGLAGMIASLNATTGASIAPSDLLTMNFGALATIVMMTGAGHVIGVALRMPRLVR